MTLPVELPPPVRDLAETLAVCADAPVRSRLLLEGVLALGASRSVALWRRMPATELPDAGGGSPGARSAAPRSEAEWRPVLSRGRVETLAPEGLVVAALEGRLASMLPGRHRVLGATPGADAALVLGEACEQEDRIDLAEALFACWAAADLVGFDALEAMSAPLPGGQAFAAGTDDSELTHDLRNLLAGIRGTQQVLDELGQHLSEDERRGFETTVGRECRRAGELVARIVDTGRPADTPPDRPLEAPSERTTGATRDALREDAAVRVVRDVVASERTRAAGLGVRVSLEEQPVASELCVALSDLDLERVLRNLLVNAREAILREPNRTEGSVAVTVDVLATDPAEAAGALAGAGEPTLRIQVRDDGPGIPAGLGPSLARRGVSGKGAEERGNGVCGLGLATVSKLVRAAGGRLEYCNIPAGGACFEVLLPARRGPGQAPLHTAE